ncbi:hypothetical protein D0962_23170 [Leptolyngbyaceae cyanobacterium CCMR0082]|uniref:Uncharacterized protein n=1 Tax=Adonisia turfae CCMR0082 TaxID=2304604 RepID=A0A6M0SCA0_9CYAN|nr:hypothetical protein [Adonisia turfae CCMR0082]
MILESPDGQNVSVPESSTQSFLDKGYTLPSHILKAKIHKYLDTLSVKDIGTAKYWLLIEALTNKELQRALFPGQRAIEVHETDCLGRTVRSTSFLR